MAEHLNYIAGQWQPAASGKTFADCNPADENDPVGVFPDSDATDVQAAVEAVAAAQPAWAALSPEARGAVLEKAAAVMAARADDIARELTREEGKTLDEARMESRRISANLRLYAGEALRLYGETFPVEGNQVVMTLRQPVGIVGVITPWNFPLAMAARKIAPALAAGNGVVFKPSQVTPLMGQRLIEVLLEAGLPPGIIALVQGKGRSVGHALTGHARLNAITFTGSYQVGAAIQANTGTNTRCQLEMGGKNPCIVLADADLEKAVAIILKGAFGLTGQACTGTSRVLVAEALHDRLVDALAAAASAIPVGNGLTPGVKMGPLASRSQLEKVLEYINIGRQEGGRIVAGGERLRGAGYDCGNFVQPTIFTHLPHDSRLAREEIFGPVLTVEKITGLDEAIQRANDNEYGLSAAIVTGNLAHALRFAREVQAGIVKVNSPTTGVALNAPFGGFRHSSNQAAKEQSGDTVMDFYTQTKTVYLAG